MNEAPGRGRPAELTVGSETAAGRHDKDAAYPEECTDVTASGVNVLERWAVFGNLKKHHACIFYL